MKQERMFDLTEPLDMLRYVAMNPIMWPGLYDNAIVPVDGGVICHQCVVENYRGLFRATKNRDYDSLEVAGLVNMSIFEDEIYCNLCNKELTT